MATKKIQYLTPAQWQRAYEIRQMAWDCASSGKWDETAAKEFVNWLYTNFLHLDPPLIFMAQDPLQCELLANILKTISKSKDTLEDTLRDTLEDTLEDTLRCTLEDTLRCTLEGTLRDTLRDTLEDTLEDTLRCTLEGTLRGTLRDTQKTVYFNPTFYTSIYDFGFAAYYLFAIEQGFCSHPLQDYFRQTFAASLGFFLPFNKIAVICPPPVLENGVARWASGYSIQYEKREIPDIILTPHLNVGARNGKAVALVDGQVVSQCRYALVTCTTDTQVYDVDELIQKYAIPESKARSALKKEGFTLADEVFVHASNLQAWVELGYDARVVHSQIAWNILRHLRFVDPDAEYAFLEQVCDRWANGSETSRIALQETIPDVIAEMQDGGMIN